MVIAELIAELGFDLKNEGDLRRFEAGLAGAQSKLTAFAAAVTRIGVAVGAAAATGLAALAKSVVSTSAEFEKYEATLTTIEGSSEKARTAMDWIGDFARKTPFAVDELTRAFVKLRSYGLDPMDGSMTQMGDTAAGMGKSLDQVVEAVADAATFQFERLRELGIVASQKGNQVTFSWTENGKALTRTINKTSADVTKFLYEVWDKKFNGAMIRQSKTWEGMMSNLGDSWEMFKLKIGRAGFFDAVKSRLGDFLDYVGELDQNGTLDRWAKNLSNLFEGVTGSVGRFVWGIGKLGEKISEGLKKLTGGKLDVKPLYVLAGIGAMLVRAFSPWAFALGVAWIALDEILGYMRGDQSFIGDFITKIEQLTGASEGLAQAIAAVVGGLGLLFLMKPGLLLGGLGKTLGKLIPGFGGAAAGSAAAGETAASSGLVGAAASLLARVSPFLAMLFTPGDTPKDREYTPEQLDRDTDTWTEKKGYDRSGADTMHRGRRDRGDVERERSLDDYLDIPTVRPTVEQPTIRADVINPKVEPSVGPAVVRPTVEQPTIRADIVNPKVEPDVGPAIVKPSVEQPTIRADVEQPTVRPKVEQPTVRLPDVVATPPARPARVPAIQPVDTTLASQKMSSIADGIVAAGEMMRSAIERASAYVAGSAEAYAAERGSIRGRAAAVNTGEGNPLKAMLENMNANLAKMTPEKAVQATVTDARQDNRQFPVTVSTTVNQTVTQPSAAPAAAARATGEAVGQAAARRASRFEMGPAF